MTTLVGAILVGIGSVELSSALDLDGFGAALILFALIAGYVPLATLFASGFGPHDPHGTADPRQRD